jgi:hypothetical protein
MTWRRGSRPTVAASSSPICADDGVATPPAVDADAVQFTGRCEQRLLSGVGHNIPQEAPAATLRALSDLTRG